MMRVAGRWTRRTSNSLLPTFELTAIAVGSCQFKSGEWGVGSGKLVPRPAFRRAEKSPAMASPEARSKLRAYGIKRTTSAVSGGEESCVIPCWAGIHRHERGGTQKTQMAQMPQRRARNDKERERSLSISRSRSLSAASAIHQRRLRALRRCAAGMSLWCKERERAHIPRRGIRERLQKRDQLMDLRLAQA